MINIVTKNWKITNIEAIFFDKDGTIIDSHIYWGEIVKRRAKEIINYFNLNENFYFYLSEKMGFSIKKNMLLQKGPTGLHSRDVIIRTIVEILNKKNIKTNFNEIENIFNKVHSEFLNDITEYTKIIKEAYDFILKLKKEKIKLALITSDSIKNSLIILKNNNLDNIFDLVIAKENCEKPKVSGEPALFALKNLNIDPLKTICIGDAPMDKIMSENAKLKAAILVSTGQINYNSLKRITKYSVKSLKELEIKRE